MSIECRAAFEEMTRAAFPGTRRAVLASWSAAVSLRSSA